MLCGGFREGKSDELKLEDVKHRIFTQVLVVWCGRKDCTPESGAGRGGAAGECGGPVSNVGRGNVSAGGRADGEAERGQKSSQTGCVLRWRMAGQGGERLALRKHSGVGRGGRALAGARATRAAFALCVRWPHRPTPTPHKPPQHQPPPPSLASDVPPPSVWGGAGKEVVVWGRRAAASCPR